MSIYHILSADVDDDANNNSPLFSAVGKAGHFLWIQVLSLVLVSFTSFLVSPSDFYRPQFLFIKLVLSSLCLILHLRLLWVSSHMDFV